MKIFSNYQIGDFFLLVRTDTKTVSCIFITEVILPASKLENFQFNFSKVTLLITPIIYSANWSLKCVEIQVAFTITMSY